MKRLALALLLSLWCSAASATALFAVCVTTCTWDGSSTLMWSTSSGGATGAGPPGAADTVTLDASTCVGGVTCTITVNTNVTVTSINMQGCTASTTGCILDFSANNNNVTLSTNSNAINCSGTGVRTLKMGNGTWNFTTTVSNGSNLINCGGTNFTLQANGSTILISGSTAGGGIGKTISISGSATFTFNNLTITGSGNYVLSINPAAIVFNTISIGPKVNLLLTQSAFTVTSIVTTSTSSSPASIEANTPSLQYTISAASGTQNLSWIAIRDMLATGGATFTATNSLDLGNNAGITITNSGGSGGGTCIIGGWLLWRDLPNHLNDNFPAWIEKAA